MPGIERLASELGDSGIELLTVSCGDDKRALEDFMRQNNYTFPVALDEEGKLREKYGFLLPTAFLLDTGRRAVVMVEGAFDWSDVSIETIQNAFKP
jgi:peroxiredoxin